MASCHNCNNLLPRTVDRCPVCGAVPLPDEVVEELVDHTPGWSNAPAPTAGGVTPDAIIDHLEGTNPLPEHPAPPARPNDSTSGSTPTSTSAGGEDDDLPTPSRTFTPPPLPEPTGLDPMQPKRTAAPVPTAWGGTGGPPLDTRTESGERLDERSIKAMSSRIEGNVVVGPKSNHKIAVGAAVAVSAFALLIGGWSGAVSSGSGNDLLAYNPTGAEISNTEIDAAAAWAAENRSSFVTVRLNGCGGALSIPGVAVADRTIIAVASAIETDATPSVVDGAGVEHIGDTIAVDAIQDLAVIRLETPVPSALTWGTAQGIAPGAIVTVIEPGIEDVTATPTEVLDIAQQGSAFEGLELDGEWAHGSIVIRPDGLIAGVVQRDGTTATNAADLSRFVSGAVLDPDRITRICPTPPTTLPPVDSTETTAEG